MALVNQDAELMLEQWGIWSRTGRPGPGRYRSPAGRIQSLMVEQQEARPACVFDDRVMEDFDRRIMGAVRRSSPRAYSAAYVYYVQMPNASFRHAGAKVGVGKDTFRSLLMTAIAGAAAAMEMVA